MEVQNAAQNEIKPDSWLVWSILATLLCCLPFGVVGIVFASKVDGLWAVGQCDQARAMAQKAKTWTLVSIFSAIAVWLIYVVLVMGLGIGAGMLSELQDL